MASQQRAGSPIWEIRKSVEENGGGGGGNTNQESSSHLSWLSESVQKSELSDKVNGEATHTLAVL